MLSRTRPSSFLPVPRRGLTRVSSLQSKARGRKGPALLLFFTLALLPLSAQESGKGNLQGEFESRIKERTAEGKLIFRGDFKFTYPNLFLVTADQADYDPKTQEIAIEGNVKVDYHSKLGLIDITAHRMSYNLSTHQGVMEEVSVDFKGSFFFDGERLEILDPDHYLIVGGTVTACNQPVPQWSLSIREAIVEKEGYAFVKSATFRLKHLPVFYFPYTIIPVMRERTSGLLFPETGNSERNGTFYGQPFYWAPRDDIDFTITPFYYDKAGTKWDLETRYQPRPDMSGFLRGQYIDDDIIKKSTAAGTPPSEGGKPIGKERFRLQVHHLQNLWKGHLDVTVEDGSDFFVDRDFLKDPRKARLRDYYYKARFDRNFGERTLSFRVNKVERILVDPSQISEVDLLPEVRLFQPTRPVGGGFYLRGEALAGAVRFKNLGPEQSEDSVLRLGLDTELSRKGTLGRYLQTRYGLAYQGTFHKDDDTTTEETTGGGFGFLETTGPRLSRTYQLKNRSLIHYLDMAVTTTLGAHAQDPFRQGIFFDELDIRIGRQSDGAQSTWKLNSRFFFGDGAGIRPVLEAEIRQNLDWDNGDQANQPIETRVRLLNLNGLHIHSIFDYSPDRENFDTLSLYGNVNKGSWRGFGGYVRRDNEVDPPQDSLIMISQWNLSRIRSSFKIDFEYDFLLNQFKSQEIKYGFSGQCVTLYLNYVRSEFASSKDDGKDFFQLLFNLRNLGEIGAKF